MIRLVLRSLFWIHNFTYRVIGVLAIKAHNGIHPKHKILKYYTFFTNKISPGYHVLDVGCGNGALAYHLAKVGSQVTAIDISARNISFAKKRFSHKNIIYIVGDATTYPFTETFDAVSLSNVLEHIKNRVLFLVSLKKLSPKFFIRVPLITRDWLAVYKKECGAEYRLDNTHYIEYTEEQFEDEIKTAGLQVDSYYVKFGELYAEVSHTQ